MMMDCRRVEPSVQQPSITPHRQRAPQRPRILLKRFQQVRHHLHRALGIAWRNASGRALRDARKMAADQLLDAGSLADRGAKVVGLVVSALGAHWEISHHGTFFRASAGAGL